MVGVDFSARNELHAYTVHALAKDQYRWRIDWFGAVTYAERDRRPSQPLIEIQLSQVSEAMTDALDLFGPPSDRRAITKQIRLPVGFLPMLAVGDIWQNGKCVESPNYDLARFDVLVNRRDAVIIKAGLPDEDCGEYYLPNAQHPYHMQHTQSYCVRVKSGSSIIVVPAVELLRFYFGSSSAVISRLFDAPFSEENFWTAIDNQDSDTPRIHLAAGISGKSASDIGRIAFSKTARAAAELIGNSCIIATVHGERAYPKMIFPFEGITSLTASGKWLSFSGQDKGVFLVFRLISCSHPFPFERLRYTSERASKSSNEMRSKSTEVAGSQGIKKMYSKRQSDSKVLDDKEPLKAKTARAIRFFFGTVKFPDLTGKPIAKVEDEVVPTLLISKKGLSIINSSSVGEAGMDTSVQPIELALSDAGSVQNSSPVQKQPTAIAVFFQILDQFSQSGVYHSVDIVRLSKRQRHDFLSTLPQTVNDDGEIAPWCIVSKENDIEGSSIVSHNRRISIGRAEALYATCYLMIPEAQGNHAPVELHIIKDITRSIKSIPDLMAAMAVHFSGATLGKVDQLNDGVTSTKAISSDNTSSMQISNELFKKAFDFINGINSVSPTIFAP